MRGNSRTGRAGSVYLASAVCWIVALTGQAAISLTGPAPLTWWMPWLGSSLGLLTAGAGHVLLGLDLRRAAPRAAPVGIMAGAVAAAAAPVWLAVSGIAAARQQLPGTAEAGLAAVAGGTLLVATIAVSAAAWRGSPRLRLAGRFLAAWVLLLPVAVVAGAALGVPGGPPTLVYAVCAVALTAIGERLQPLGRSA